MQTRKVQFTAMICLWLYSFRKGNGLKCSTGHPPLWESSTKRCTFYINWDCSLGEGEEILLKTWKKDDEDNVASCALTLDFTTENGFKGRVERYKEYGLILKDITTQDTGYYKLVMIIKVSGLQVNTSSVYIPSIPSCESDLFYVGTDTKHVIGGNNTNQDSKCDGGKIPDLILGLLVALGIMTIVLFPINIYLCRKYRLSQNNLRNIPNIHNERREELSLISSPP